mmetsp:Transcript_33094/g.55695  ORF Transcript_33094/g.55695 Transcript_33094/m.55695 type:complete len:438 (-) Transcript_33094:240-1553(-)|eukprot:CAMPEP_0174977284 /NCGR_PEP_ID=MMETSP0004_2-20121128/13519_1 /TAXON_ID=420556 /ORGANISM="Ochromonas sp., Strain CCMP1393" /LENGTH=437 /DNA_ID=CAMNT_0016228441 /DNA_START=59 /DNA_END=1372 /DNA_ORIENTATION=+
MASSKQMLSSLASRPLLESAARKIVLSGPSGFLGTHVLDSILDVHQIRIENGEEPGEVILLSSSPGNMMRRLESKYGEKKMKTIRASRVDYFTQHSVDTWRDHLGSLGVLGDKATFVNLAAVAGPIPGKLDAMMDVNYLAPIAAAKACEQLGFGHWVQSSTQATNAERAGQVPYSRHKAMADFALTRIEELPVTIACLGLIYSKADGLIGQSRDSQATLNLIDLSLLPLTPIMGNGSAPLQPQEVTDAAQRIVYLAMTDPSLRPVQLKQMSQQQLPKCPQVDTVRFYDAVGPETISILEMLQRFASYQGVGRSFRPVHVDYRNMERVLNVKSLGNLNRQFVSLLRSEQDADRPIIGNPDVWASLLGDGSALTTMDEAFQKNNTACGDTRRFPYLATIQWALQNPRVIPPGIALGAEILHAYLFLPEAGRLLHEKNRN